MFAVNDDFYEDLTPETTKKLLADLKSGNRKIKPGPMSGRKSCEPSKGLTSLKEEPWGPGAHFRTYLRNHRSTDRQRRRTVNQTHSEGTFVGTSWNGRTVKSV